MQSADAVAPLCRPAAPFYWLAARQGPNGQEQLARQAIETAHWSVAHRPALNPMRGILNPLQGRPSAILLFDAPFSPALNTDRTVPSSRDSICPPPVHLIVSPLCCSPSLAYGTYIVQPCRNPSRQPLATVERLPNASTSVCPGPKEPPDARVPPY
jgi:hypothetical protein